MKRLNFVAARWTLGTVLLLAPLSSRASDQDQAVENSLQAAHLDDASKSFAATRGFMAKFRASPENPPEHPPGFNELFLSREDRNWLFDRAKAIILPQLEDFGSSDEQVLRQNASKLDGQGIKAFLITRTYVKKLVRSPNETLEQPKEFNPDFCTESENALVAQKVMVKVWEILRNKPADK